MSESDFLDDISAGLDEVNELAGETFTIAGVTVSGDFTGTDESVKLSVGGSQEEIFRGTLVISRKKLPAKPILMSIIKDAAATCYRIALIHPDAVSWTLSLTKPNARRA